MAKVMQVYDCDTCQAQHEFGTECPLNNLPLASRRMLRMEAAIRGALAIENLWMPMGVVDESYSDEVSALATMRQSFVESLKHG